jgi:hypothetical protein
MGLSIKTRNYIYDNFLGKHQPDPLIKLIADTPTHYAVKQTTTKIDGTRYASVLHVHLMVVLHKLGLRMFT